VPKRQTKYIFVTGGVLSGLGKGITAASIGAVLKARGLSINIQKCDPYLNVDAGTLNPAEHGETFVTADGRETDLDLGHYERFLDVELKKTSALMNGQVMQGVIDAERRGDFLGKTVQMVPHVTDAIQDYIEQAGEGYDIHIVEIGGTVGDYEGLAFIEAIREFANRVGQENCLYAHLVYVPYLGASSEFKTKPSQNAVRQLRSVGITPDILAVRSESAAPVEIKAKLSMFTGIDPAGIVLLPNAPSVYEVPLTVAEAKLDDYIADKLQLPDASADMSSWSKLAKRIGAKYDQRISVGIIAKYLDNDDTYISVIEALKAAAWYQKMGLDISWVDAEKVERSGTSQLKKFDAIVVPGGFGSRGIEGKIAAAEYAIKHNTPYLGLCLGMQVATIAFARTVLKGSVNTQEIDPDCDHPVIALMADQQQIKNKGGTMRLGDYPCALQKGSLARKLYGSDEIQERHRHRFELNNAYREQLGQTGLIASGTAPDDSLVEVVELKDHRFFIASQFHPEFTSRPHRPHPLFNGLIAEAGRTS